MAKKKKKKKRHKICFLLQQQRLIPQVKTEKRDGSSTNDPYVAFRRRTEKMQTRKVTALSALFRSAVPFICCVFFQKKAPPPRKKKLENDNVAESS